MCAGLIQFVATLALGLPGWTDSLALKNERIYIGTFVSVSSDYVALQIDSHVKHSFTVSKIDSMRFRRSTEARFTPIDQRYAAYSQTLGMPAGNEQAVSDGRGRYRMYEKGAIYYTPQTGAHVVQGPIGDRWRSLGAEHSELGYPTSDEFSTPDGHHLMRFEHGCIIWDQRDVPMVEISAR